MVPLSALAGYYVELDVLCIILLLQMILKTRSSSFIETQKHYFEQVLLCHIIFSTTDLIWVFNNGFLSLLEVFPEHGIAFSYAANSLNILFSGITGFSWLLFSEVMQGDYIVRDRRKLAAALLPLLLLALLTATTGRTHILFYLSEQGEFFRNFGYAVQVGVAMGYVVVATLLSARRMLRAETIQDKKRSHAIMSFITVPFCAAVLQVVFPRMQVIFLGTVIALISVYISLQETQILTDPLTGLNNRTQLDQKVNNAIRKRSDEYEMYLMLIDVDNFKSINDRYGHIVGDHVLQEIAHALRHNCNATDYVCRYGGDEFVVLHYAPPKEGCTQFVQRVNQTLSLCDAPCPVSVSSGACRYTEDIRNVNEWLKAADRDMYRIKTTRTPRRPKNSQDTQEGVNDHEEK